MTAGGALAGGLATGCGSASHTHNAAAPAAARPRRGGHLNVGMAGGSSSDTVDAHKSVTYLDTGRLQSLYEPLAQLDGQGNPENLLAESITPHNNGLTEWVIRLHKGVTFHNGKPLTADDVIFSFQRVLHNSFSGKLGLGPIDIKNTTALDSHTVLVKMTRPFASFPQQLASFWLYLFIVPVGYNPAKPIGTGPFIFQSFVPGQRSVFVRNPHYWRTGLPYVETLTITDFPDTTSLQDALVTGVIQAAGNLDGPQIAALQNQGGVHAVASRTGEIQPFTMRIDRPPFNDVRVRQAMRLLVDRGALISSALDGFGTEASDLFSPFDPDFDRSLRRAPDIPHAMHLLKQAGQEDLRVALVTSNIATSTVAMATVMAQQAKAAGVTVNLQNVPANSFFETVYLKSTFSQDYYNYFPYLTQVAQSMLPGSPFNETHNNNPAYTSLYNQANATTNASLTKELLYRMQQIDFNEGGYIIPAYVDSLDAYSDKIGGYTAARVGQPLSNLDFEHFYFV
jgi:peptide/nickel transport system substrate-binding protein